MSRSRKKTAVFTDSNPENKKKASRRVRKAVKNAIKKGHETMPLTREHTNPYDICDFRFYPTKKKDKLKALRK